MILWGIAQVLGWMVGVCGGREKTTESLGTNGDGIHIFSLRQTFDSVRPFFALVPWMDYFSPFPNGGVEPESTTNVTPTRTGKNPTLRTLQKMICNPTFSLPPNN